MAGAVGFEPTHADTKNRCLTAWPRPNMFFHSMNRIFSVRMAIRQE